jgi:aryl-alcohol dehydrogenase-like predicted oxidoreductase
MLEWSRIGTVALGDGHTVRRVGFGGAWLTGPGTYGPPPDLNAARGAVRRAVDAGVQLVDTADCYGPEISERLIAESLHPYPDGVVVSTKGGRLPLGNNRWRADGRPEHLREACEASLRRLRLGAIGLYQLNAVDPEVPLEESLGALVELREEGKIRAIGVCNVDAAQLERAGAVTSIASVQDRYDLLTRENEPVLEACARQGIAFLAWFPPSAGFDAEAGSALHHVAAAHDATTRQVMLAWIVAHSLALVPLPGAPDPGRYGEDLDGIAIELTTDEVALLR